RLDQPASRRLSFDVPGDLEGDHGAEARAARFEHGDDQVHSAHRVAAAGETAGVQADERGVAGPGGVELRLLDVRAQRRRGPLRAPELELGLRNGETGPHGRDPLTGPPGGGGLEEIAPPLTTGEQFADDARQFGAATESS